MTDYSEVCYKNTFLNQVIIRVDYHQFLPTESVFDPIIEKAIVNLYPRRRPDQLIRFNAINVVFDSTQGMANTNSQVIDGIQREYQSTTGKNKLLLSNKYIVFEINEYQSFAEHIKAVKSILTSFCSINKFTASRVGIRYINIFDSNRTKIQKNYFTPEVASTVWIPTKDNENTETRLLRSMHLSEYAVDAMTLNFRYGSYNPDFPNPLCKSDFALDFDCFSEEPSDELEEIIQKIINGHHAIQNLFEYVITNTLRKVMRGE